MQFVQAAHSLTNGPLSGDCFSKDQGDSCHGNRNKLKSLNEQEGARVLYALPVSLIKAATIYEGLTEEATLKATFDILDLAGVQRCQEDEVRQEPWRP